jgi:hypothetical protein
MGRAQITNGIWTRNVTWEHNGEWRSDVFKSTLSDVRLKQVRFILKGGPIVLMPASELRRILESGTDHYGGKIWGPFKIIPRTKTVNGQEVQMDVVK